MLFNSIDFAFFLPIVFISYWLSADSNLKFQNFLIVVASYVFYGWLDWRFLSLLIVITIVNFSTGLLLLKEKKQKKRKFLLLVTIVVDIGFLAYFKYVNFFIENFIDVLSLIGIKIGASSLDIILPVGISFYTFQALGYSIDVYEKKIEPVNDIIVFAAFLSFFPQLLAGPIGRATHLLPQFYTKRTFDASKAVDGMRQILWGLFKKVVIADNCAEFASQVFNNYSNMNGSTLLLGAVFFTFQIYGDFSGYSDVAIGTARLFGFDLMKNFSFPFFSKNIAEFWRRWHISLSTWFRDYLYIPLGGSHGTTWMKIRNTFIVFIISGFWHGANWTFIFWGILNAIYLLPSLLMKGNRKNLECSAQVGIYLKLKIFFQISLTFFLTVLAWIFFKAENIGQAFDYLHGIFSVSFFETPHFPKIITMIFIVLFILIEWKGRCGRYGIEYLGLRWRRSLRWAMYYGMIISIFYFANTQQEFIYFKF